VPNEQMAVVDFVTTGTTYAETVGVKGSVQLYSDSTLPFQIRQRVYVRPEGVEADGIWSCARSDSTLTGITTDFCLLDRLVKKLAYKQYLKKREQAQSIAARHAEERLTESSQAEAAPSLR